MEENFWRRCGSCKKEIPYNSVYQSCSVSSCNKLAFCSVDCWDTHVPVMNHKSAWAEEGRAPRRIESSGPQPVRRLIVEKPISGTATSTSNSTDDEILIVASKLKQYVKDKYDLSTSANVMDALSREVRRLTDQAVQRAREEGRKTLMDRDF